MSKPVRLDEKTHKDISKAISKTVKAYTKALAQLSKCGVDIKHEKFPDHDKTCRTALQTITMLFKLQLMIQQEEIPEARKDEGLEELLKAVDQQVAEIGDEFEE